MEKYDIRFKLENFDFHSRASVIIYNEEKNKVLLFKVEDGRNFYLLPGGKIQLGEDSLSAIKREVSEEIGYSLDYRFCSINENFVKLNEKDIMQYEFLYKAIYNQVIEKEVFKCKDREGQTFHWVDISKINEIDIRPNNIKEIIKNVDSINIHNIYKD